MAYPLSIDPDSILAAAMDSERCREILDALPVAVYTTDAQGRLTHFNRAAVALSGRSPKLGVDKWCVAWKLYRPDGTLLPLDECPMAVALKERRPVRGEQGIAERPDGTRFRFEPYPTPLFDADGNLTGGINILLDVTARNEATEALKQNQQHLADELHAIECLQQVSMQLAHAENSESLYERIMDAAVTIMRADFASMQMLYPERGSNGELRLLAFRGFDPDSAKFWEWVRADSGCTCGQVLRTGTRAIASDVETCAFMAGTPDRTALLQAGMLAAQSTPLLSREGKLVGMISTHWKRPHQPSDRDLRLLDVLARQAADWIERLQADEQLRESESRLRQLAADLSEADRRKDEFLAMLAHELRNPLAPIRNAVQILRLAGNNGEIVQRNAEMMDRQVGHLVRLVDDLLDVSRITRGKIELRRQRVELASAINHAVEGVRPQCERLGQDLKIAIPQQPVFVHADPIRLAQIVGNLLNNACKFADKGGCISLTVEREGDEAVMRVKDNGIGIAADQVPRIFDMFVQIDTSLERSGGGLGIGLTLVKTLVEMHEGSVSAHSDGIGQGAEFTVRLPLLTETVSPTPSTNAAREASSETQ